MIGKALLIGIDNYPNGCELNCCVNDVLCLKDAIEFNYDGSRNFSIKTLTNEEASRSGIRSGLNELFAGEGAIALFYFSGHGIDDKNDGFIVSQNFERDDYGIPMSEILRIASQSKFTYKIIILDCCHSGFMGNYGIIGETSALSEGTVIMTASRKDESAIEVSGHGVFTNLLIEALKGGASDVLGNVTPGSIYAFIDQALGQWAQRPLFKANISSFVSLKKCEPKITIDALKEAITVFKDEKDIFSLDPSYEKTNIEGGEHKNCPPYAIEKNVELMKKLQICNRNGLIIPYESSDMYFAAMDSKGCVLTPLGRHYWKMITEEVI